MTRFCHTCAALLLALGGCALHLQPCEAAESRPNIVWLSCEDLSPHLGCYGDPVARTPHLDHLAQRSARFTQACSVAGVCAPSRSAIITGMYPTTLGTHLMRCRARLPADVVPFPTLLRQAGYYATNNSKTDYQFEPPPGVWDESSAKAHWRNRSRPEQPFFAVFNFTGTHESAVVPRAGRPRRANAPGVTSRQAAAQTLPPYYPDTPAVRQEWGKYYDCIAALDDWVGKMLAELDAAGLSQNTIVFFWSDHGAGLPRAKRWIYDSGVRVPLLVHVPQALGGAATGTTDDRLVSLVDLGPTVLRLAGVDVPKNAQGQAFLGPDQSPPRRYQHLVRDRMDERYDTIRAVRTAQWKYLRNDRPWLPYMQHVEYGEQSVIMQELRRLAANGELPPAAAAFAAPHKPVEELYDLTADPHEVHNLAAEPTHAAVLQELRSELQRWRMESHDLGRLPEAEIVRREAQWGSRLAILQQPGALELQLRLRMVVDAGTAPDGHAAELLRAADDPDAAVRYWALVGLARLSNIGQDAVAAFRHGLADEAGCVRAAAARGLAAAGDTAAALAALGPLLEGEDVWTALEAALVLDELGPRARPLLGLLETVAQRPEDVAFGTRYAPRVARHAVQVLTGQGP